VTGCCRTTNGPSSPAASCTAPASPPTARTTTQSAGSPSATPPTTSTWSPCWPARTAPRPRLWNDYYKVGEACRAAEDRLGLRRAAARDRTAAPRPTRAEHEKARRRGLPEPPRVTLRAVSTAAATASSEHEFFACLDAAGISVRKRFSTRNPGEVTGFAVALPADTTQAGGPVWYSGGKLTPDLTLPKLRHRWAHAGASAPGTTFTSAERNALYEHAARTAAHATEQIKNFALTDPDVAADAAWASADTLHVTAKLLGNRVIRQAADAYDRAARLPCGRVPRPSPLGNDLRHAARQAAERLYAARAAYPPRHQPNEPEPGPEQTERAWTLPSRQRPGPARRMELLNLAAVPHPARRAAPELTRGLSACLLERSRSALPWAAVSLGEMPWPGLHRSLP
jgi:hypothetical protein